MQLIHRACNGFNTLLNYMPDFKFRNPASSGSSQLTKKSLYEGLQIQRSSIYSRKVNDEASINDQINKMPPGLRKVVDGFYKDLTWVLLLRSEAATSFFKLMPRLVSLTFYCTITAFGYWYYDRRLLASVLSFVYIATLLTWPLKAYFGTQRPTIER